MKKLIILLIILSLVLGGFTFVYQVFLNKETTNIPVETLVEEEPKTQLTVTTRDILEERPPELISDDELIAQIKNKKYLESSYLALEYSKISNAKLIDVIKNYLEDNLGTKPEDIREIIDLQERTFLNRYLKIYVLTPDSSIQDTDSSIKNSLYQMKSAYSTFAAYGRRALSPEQQEEMANASADAPVTFDYSDLKPQYDDSSLKLGVQALESANSSVDEVLKEIGTQDILIEKAWMDAQITTEDLTEVLNQTNSITNDLVLDGSSSPIVEEKVLNEQEELTLSIE